MTANRLDELEMQQTLHVKTGLTYVVIGCIVGETSVPFGAWEI